MTPYERRQRIDEQAERLKASRARLEAELGPIPALTEEELDASETEIHNCLRRGRAADGPGAN